MNCSNKMKGRTKEALTYFKASLIESVWSNPIMNEITSNITLAPPNTFAIDNTVLAIQSPLLINI